MVNTSADLRRTITSMVFAVLFSTTAMASVIAPAEAISTPTPTPTAAAVA